MKMKLWHEISKKEQIERWQQVLRVLRALTPHQRRKHWDMSDFGYKNECGTVACAAGHCGLDPWFRRRNFRMDFKQCKGIDGSTWFEHEISDCDDFFGHEGSNRIFYDSSTRTVGQVIREIREYIKELEAFDVRR